MGKIWTTVALAAFLAVTSSCGLAESSAGAGGTAADRANSGAVTAASSGSGGGNWIMADTQYGVAAMEAPSQPNQCAADGACIAR